MPPRPPDTPPLPIIISYEPTELILVDGEVQLEAIGQDGLQFVSNTRNDLFLLDGHYYVLLSGRWFSTKDFKRQWSYVKNCRRYLLIFLQIIARPSCWLLSPAHLKRKRP